MNPEKAVRRYAKNTEWVVPHCINGSYTKVQVSETETMTMAEIKKMQKKLALLEEENIILKKAMAIFSRESGKE